MIGRFLGAAIVVATLCMSPAAAATDAAPPTQVTWHHDGSLTWQRVEHHAIAPPTVRRLVPQLAPGRTKVIAAGSPGVAEAWVQYDQRAGGAVHRSVLFTKVLRVPRKRIVAEGIGTSPLAAFEAHSIARMTSLARSAMSAMQMIATAYTADSAGGSGMTAIGRRAGYGIVAVDPRIIPTRHPPLYPRLWLRRRRRHRRSDRRASHRSRLRHAARRDAFRPARRHGLPPQVA